MKIVIPGGSGQVGHILARAFHRRGDEVVVLSRNPAARPWRVVPWDGVSLGNWQAELEACDAVINLAGRSVNCRYNPRNRAEILNSRLNSTAILGQAIAKTRQKPRVWLQAGTATIYAHRYDAPNDEYTGRLGGEEADAPSEWNFSIAVAKAWESTFESADVGPTRKLILRSAMTMSPDAGGVFATLYSLVRLGLGGSAGDGRQFVSWIHEEDFVAAVRWLLEREDMHGVVNLAAPNPLPNADFMRELRLAAGVPFGFPAQAWMLELGAIVLRTETELLLKSRRVGPTRLLETGFRFRYATWEEAAKNLCAAMTGK